jgi:hypothetical protein
MWNRVLSPIEGHFFKINATENLDGRVMSELGRFAALPDAGNLHVRFDERDVETE